LQLFVIWFTLVCIECRTTQWATDWADVGGVYLLKLEGGFNFDNFFCCCCSFSF
jgi:hypothetical protein